MTTSKEQKHAELRKRAIGLSVADRFRMLHEEEVYFGRQSRSGPGSDDDQTAIVRDWLPGIVSRYGVSSILDAPCGDCRWMSQIDFLGVDYVGVDCVEPLIGENRQTFPGVEFRCLDILSDPLPPAEMIVCRDLLVHLSNSDVLLALTRFVGTGARWLVTNTYGRDRTNIDILSGVFRPIDLLGPPFELPPPLELCIEGSTHLDGQLGDKALGIWDLGEVEEGLTGPAAIGADGGRQS